jgi:predicted transcriptional regulator of viral defense system
MVYQVSTRQQRLATLLKVAPNTIHVADLVTTLGIDRQHAAKLLAGWHKQGIIRRVARGLYVPILPSALKQTQVLADPWILVPELYQPGYIGGWSALEYWELTEQLFRPICVLTNKRTWCGEVKHQGVSFFIKRIPKQQLFGTRVIWRNQIKLQISDPHKTILDIIDDQNIGAGLQHVLDSLHEYKRLYAKQEDMDKLLQYAKQINNGALFKKLGFLAEKLGYNRTFTDECAKHLTTGYAYLDKTAKSNKLVTKWRLWVPRGQEL